MVDPVAIFGRTDKTALAGGDGIAFVPSGDVETTGFWDGAVVLGRSVSPLFAVTILDQHGGELVARMASRRWNPSALVAEYRFAHGIQATEVRTVHPGGVFVSEWRVTALRPTALHVVAWTAIDSGALRAGSVSYDGALTCTRETGEGAVQCSLAVLGGATSWGAYLSDGVLDAPLWRLTPFLEHWQPDGFPHAELANAPVGRCFAAVHRAIQVSGKGAAVTFAMRVVPVEQELQTSAAAQSAAPSSGTFESASRRRWDARFASVPHLQTSDPYIERAYWYRWFGAWLHRLEPGTGRFEHGGASANARMIGVADATLVPAAVRDLRWHPDRAWARGAFFQILSHQLPNGSYPRMVTASGVSAAIAPPTIDWGGALRAFASSESDDEHVALAWRSLERYARWLYETHDAKDSGLLDLRHPQETDGAASPRFLSTTAARGSGKSRRPRALKGVDATAYGFAVCQSLARLAPRAGATGSEWSDRAEHIAAAAREHHWDEALGFFCDYDAEAGERVRIRTSAGFVPLAVGLAWPEQSARIAESLLDSKRFWTAFPVPSLAADEPGFDARGEWEGVRVDVARNGRMWPADTALVIDALASADRDKDGPLRTAAAQLLRRLIRAHFADGDLHAAASFEHYNPLTGHPSAFRAVDDSHAAWLVDLIVRHAAGVHPGSRSVRIDPLPLGLDSLVLSGLEVHGRRVDIAIAHSKVVATVDGVEHQSTLGNSQRIVFSERT